MTLRMGDPMLPSQTVTSTSLPPLSLPPISLPPSTLGRLPSISTLSPMVSPYPSPSLHSPSFHHSPMSSISPMCDPSRMAISSYNSVSMNHVVNNGNGSYNGTTAASPTPVVGLLMEGKMKPPPKKRTRPKKPKVEEKEQQLPAYANAQVPSTSNGTHSSAAQLLSTLSNDVQQSLKPLMNGGSSHAGPERKLRPRSTPLKKKAPTSAPLGTQLPPSIESFEQGWNPSSTEAFTPSMLNGPLSVDVVATPPSVEAHSPLLHRALSAGPPSNGPYPSMHSPHSAPASCQPQQQSACLPTHENGVEKNVDVYSQPSTSVKPQELPPKRSPRERSSQPKKPPNELEPEIVELSPPPKKTRLTAAALSHDVVEVQPQQKHHAAPAAICPMRTPAGTRLPLASQSTETTPPKRSSARIAASAEKQKSPTEAMTAATTAKMSTRSTARSSVPKMEEEMADAVEVQPAVAEPHPVTDQPMTMEENIQNRVKLMTHLIEQRELQGRPLTEEQMREAMKIAHVKVPNLVLVPTHPDQMRNLAVGQFVNMPNGRAMVYEINGEKKLFYCAPKEEAAAPVRRRSSTKDVGLLQVAPNARARDLPGPSTSTAGVRSQYREEMKKERVKKKVLARRRLVISDVTRKAAMKLSAAHDESMANNKTQYRKAKRRFRHLVYENECYATELRGLNRELLRLARDKDFLLDRLAGYEAPDNQDLDSSEGESDIEAYIMESLEKDKEKDEEEERERERERAQRAHMVLLQQQMQHDQQRLQLQKLLVARRPVKKKNPATVQEATGVVPESVHPEVYHAPPTERPIQTEEGQMEDQQVQRCVQKETTGAEEDSDAYLTDMGESGESDAVGAGDESESQASEGDETDYSTDFGETDYGTDADEEELRQRRYRGRETGMELGPEGLEEEEPDDVVLDEDDPEYMEGEEEEEEDGEDRDAEFADDEEEEMEGVVDEEEEREDDEDSSVNKGDEDYRDEEDDEDEDEVDSEEFEMDDSSQDSMRSNQTDGDEFSRDSSVKEEEEDELSNGSMGNGERRRPQPSEGRPGSSGSQHSMDGVEVKEEEDHHDAPVNPQLARAIPREERASSSSTRSSGSSSRTTRSTRSSGRRTSARLNEATALEMNEEVKQETSPPTTSTPRTRSRSSRESSTPSSDRLR